MSSRNGPSDRTSHLSGRLPSARQLRHHARRFYGFVHFSINTFTDTEWGFGSEPPAVFDPTAFDAEQIVDSARIAGMTGLILTCKHHAGFCLWPSNFTDYSVRNSPFRQGRGDMVREVERACRAAGLEFGVYLSPWDRNHRDYGSRAYLDCYCGQLRELLTQYGETFEVWFDGANGGDGFYGGANEKRSIDNRTYYDWPVTWDLVRQLQPDAVMFSDVGPDVRWVGNESGIAGDPCWYTIDVGNDCPGQADHNHLNRGDRDGANWLIPECDVSIRPGWFYHEIEDNQVRSAKNLVDLYHASIGRGANFLLSLAPDRRGLIPEVDRQSLRAFRSHLDQTFNTDLAANATVQQRPASAPDEVGAASVITVDLHTTQRFNLVELQERISLGQRIHRFAIDAELADGRWHPIATGNGVGAQRLVRLDPIQSRQLRVRILDSAIDPDITSIRVFLEPDIDDQPTLSLDSALSVTVVQATLAELVLDLGVVTSIHTICYTPGADHRVDRYEIDFAKEPDDWTTGRRTGEFGNVRANPAPQHIACDMSARYIRFKALRFAMGDRLSPADVVVRS